MPQGRRKALLLSVGYGQGHHSAARALAEELETRGWTTTMHDPCAETYPRLFRLTQRYYHFCVRKAPWLWGVTYALTDTADWRRQVEGMPLRRCTAYVEELLRRENPDAVLCTYPLFAYMLDALTGSARVCVPYAVVVTDAIEISRPWMKTHAPLVCVTDELSEAMVRERYALTDDQVACTGFPVRSAFHRVAMVPRDVGGASVRLLYAAYKDTRSVCREVRALLSEFPGMHVTLLGGERADELRGEMAQEVGRRRVSIEAFSRDMPSLFAQHHIYVGKAGAATVFEAYAAGLPMIVNYSLPGQEQGNLQLVLHDRCGFYAENTCALLAAIRGMMMNGWRCWHEIRRMMAASSRSQGAPRIADLIERRFFT